MGQDCAKTEDATQISASVQQTVRMYFEFFIMITTITGPDIIPPLDGVPRPTDFSSADKTTRQTAH